MKSKEFEQEDHTKISRNFVASLTRESLSSCTFSKKKLILKFRNIPLKFHKKAKIRL